MGISKTALFTKSQNEIAAVAKAFAHPARIAIIEYLLKTNACINGVLVYEFGLAQATISQHLSELKKVGIIQGNIEGAKMSYCINPDRWNEIQSQFNNLIHRYKNPSPPPCC